jgi:hypothetical protein
LGFSSGPSFFLNIELNKYDSYENSVDLELFRSEVEFPPINGRRLLFTALPYGRRQIETI